MDFNYQRLSKVAFTCYRLISVAQSFLVTSVFSTECESSDVDRPVALGDVGDDDMEPGAVAQGRVHERTISQVSTRHIQWPRRAANTRGLAQQGVLPCPKTVSQRAGMRWWWTSHKRRPKSRGSSTKPATCTCPSSPGSATAATR